MSEQPKEESSRGHAPPDAVAAGAPVPVPDATSIRAGRPRPPIPTNQLGQVTVEKFPAMCNVTLHWEKIAPALREEIEDELRRNLEECRTLDNPSAGWFLGLSSLLFFLTFAVVVFFVLFSRR